MQNKREANPRPRRSALYVPGSNARAIEKAKDLAADVLIFDLEDSVAATAKDGARSAVSNAVTALIGGPREVVVRINDLNTPWVARDIAAMAAIRPDAVLIPKVDRVDDVRRARAAFAAADAPRDLPLWVMIESPAAVLNAAAIGAIAALPAPAVTAFVVGTNDLAAKLAAPARADRFALLPSLSQAILAARAHNLAIVDGTFNDLDDRNGLRAECKQGRDMGFDGKTVIHPSQVPVANETFAPNGDEIAWARQVVDAFAQPDNVGAEVMRLSGRMVERLHERAARRTLAIAEAIAELDKAMKAKAPTAAPRRKAG